MRKHEILTLKTIKIINKQCKKYVGTPQDFEKIYLYLYIYVYTSTKSD